MREALLRIRNSSLTEIAASLLCSVDDLCLINSQSVSDPSMFGYNADSAPCDPYGLLMYTVIG